MVSTKICREIGLQPEVIQEVRIRDKQLTKDGFYKKNRKELCLLQKPATRSIALETLEERIAPDEHGFGMLAVMLHTLNRTKRIYRLKGIPGEIFRATMGCFPRFVEEYKVSYGTYGFDRAFWTPRQTGLYLFRIGELEYELDESISYGVISIHIPSDAKLTPEKCRASYEQSRAFIKRYYPKWQDCEYICDSWLLAPGLKDILPETSHIIAFQNGFNIRVINENSKEFMQWVYKRMDIPYQELPEDTSLQRNMKQYLLKGGKIGEALGVLRADAWCQPVHGQEEK